MKDNKHLAIITARGGSKRLPKKNIKLFCGKPILAYSIEAALQSNLFAEVMVSTDDQDIADIAQSFGASVPFFRSAQTADDFATLSDVVEEVKSEYGKRNRAFDAICCILPTSPFVTAQSLHHGLCELQEKETAIALPIVKFSYPIQRAFKMVEGKLQMFYPEHLRTRSQDLEHAFHDAGQFYWLANGCTLEDSNRCGFEIPEIEMQDIDTPEDWEIAEMKYQWMQDNPKH